MDNTDFKITPIEHATVLIEWGGKVIITDPTDAKLFESGIEPDVILVTHLHHDHFNLDALRALMKGKTILVAPQSVDELIKLKLPGKIAVINPGEVKDISGLKIEAIQAYNIPDGPNVYHPKSRRDNGYVLEFCGKRLYISGDTSNTPELKALKNIDTAFLCMNLPYTMDPEEAAETALAFKPKIVIPYHYRQHPTNDFADIKKFKSLVTAGDPNIEVKLLEFYPRK